ncbi:MAG: cobalamin B12-binding domain-containing protein [Promethearchaeota archaeon]
MNISEFKDNFYTLTKERKYKDALSLVDLALEKRIPADKIITEGIAENLKKFQDFFDEGYENISAFQLLAIGKISEDSIEKVKPHLIRYISEEGSKQKIIIGTIKNDFHGLGKKILKLFLEMENFEVIDLGLDVAPEKFIEAVIENNASYIFVSTMMLHNIIGVKRVGDLLLQKNLKDKVKFFVGGAPFNYNYSLAEKVGADRSAEDVYQLLDLIKGRDSKRKVRFKRLKRFFGRDKL